jgi:hypothetical protein
MSHVELLALLAALLHETVPRSSGPPNLPDAALHPTAQYFAPILRMEHEEVSHRKKAERSRRVVHFVSWVRMAAVADPVDTSRRKKQLWTSRKG